MRTIECLDQGAALTAGEGAASVRAPDLLPYRPPFPSLLTTLLIFSIN